MEVEVTGFGSCVEIMIPVDMILETMEVSECSAASLQSALKEEVVGICMSQSDVFEEDACVQETCKRGQVIIINTPVSQTL